MNSETLSKVKSSKIPEIKSIEVESDNLDYSTSKNEKEETFVLINNQVNPHQRIPVQLYSQVDYLLHIYHHSI